MKRTKLLAVAAVALLAMTGCQIKKTGGAADVPGVNPCRVKVTVTPVVIYLGNDVGVTTATETTCAVAMTKHLLTLHLERQAKGKWTDKPSMLGGGGKRTCKGLPRPGVSIPCRVTLHGCISGLWRFRFELDWARVTAQGKTLEGHEERTEEYPQEIKCPGPEGVS